MPGSLTSRLTEPYDFGWSLRTIENADVLITRLGDGRREIRIDHPPLTNVTTGMLDWWFQSFDGMAEYRGRRIPAYHLWHPRDHVRVELGRDSQGRVAPGQRIAIQEVFGRDPRFEADVRSIIHRWDRRGVGFHLDVLGHRVIELDHVFKDAPEGADYRTCMRIGAGSGPLRRIINARIVARRFGPELVAAWIRHNVEEVGCFVEFLPDLFATRAIEQGAAARR